MSLLVITEDHYAPPVVYAPGTYTIDKAMTGTRYAMLAIRTFVNANDPADIKAANALQDKMEIKQASSGKFEVPNWDPVSQGAIRDHLAALNTMSGQTTERSMGATSTSLKNPNSRSHTMLIAPKIAEKSTDMPMIPGKMNCV